jgi:hypothetical protein
MASSRAGVTQLAECLLPKSAGLNAVVSLVANPRIGPSYPLYIRAGSVADSGPQSWPNGAPRKWITIRILPLVGPFLSSPMTSLKGLPVELRKMLSNEQERLPDFMSENRASRDSRGLHLNDVTPTVVGSDGGLLDSGGARPPVGGAPRSASAPCGRLAALT